MTKQPRTLYSFIGGAAMLVTPLAASITFGWRVYSEVYLSTELYWLAIPAGVGAAFGLEAVGIYAGHVTSEFYHARDGRWKLSAIIMLAYVVIGMMELWGTVGATIFIISPLVYTLVALKHTADTESLVVSITETTEAEREIEKEDSETERRRAVEDAKLEHAQKLELLKAERAHVLKMERARVKRETETKPKRETRNETNVFEVSAKVNRNGTGKRELVYEYVKGQPDATNTEIAGRVGISRQMVGRYRKEMGT